VVSFTPRPLYPRGKSPRCPLGRRLGGPHNRSERCGDEKILDPTGTRTPTCLVVQPVASRYTDSAIPAPHLGTTFRMCGAQARQAVVTEVTTFITKNKLHQSHHLLIWIQIGLLAGYSRKYSFLEILINVKAGRVK
jgi:hypothetical protein